MEQRMVRFTRQLSIAGLLVAAVLNVLPGASSTLARERNPFPDATERTHPPHEPRRGSAPGAQESRVLGQHRLVQGHVPKAARMAARYWVMRAASTQYRASYDTTFVRRREDVARMWIPSDEYRAAYDYAMLAAGPWDAPGAGDAGARR